MHPGRPWADGLDDHGVPFPDQDTPNAIDERIREHLPSMRIFETQKDVIEAILVDFGQTLATGDAETVAKAEADAVASGLIKNDV